jgi:hypothetical protein
MLSSPASMQIFRPLLVQRHCFRHRLVVFVANVTHVGVAPYLADPKNADVKTLAAVAATHGMAQDKEINQIFELQTRGAEIPRSASAAICSHRVSTLRSDLKVDRGNLDYPKPQSTAARIKIGKICYGGWVPRTGAMQDRAVTGMPAGQIPQQVRRKLQPSAVCWPRCSRLLRRPGRA